MPTPPPILDYARPDAPERHDTDPDAPWHSTNRWRLVMFACIAITPFAFNVGPTPALLTLAGLALATTLMLTAMTRAAAREITPAYAARHLLLALLLLPVLFMGPLLIPHLVQADARRLRLAGEDKDPAA